MFIFANEKKRHGKKHPDDVRQLVITGTELLGELSFTIDDE